MDPNALGGMITTLLLVAMIGGFILLFPLSRRLGALLEEKVLQSKRPPVPQTEELRALHDQVHDLQNEVRRLSERQQFTEQLLERPRTAALPSDPQ